MERIRIPGIIAAVLIGVIGLGVLLYFYQQSQKEVVNPQVRPRVVEYDNGAVNIGKKTQINGKLSCIVLRETGEQEGECILGITTNDGKTFRLEDFEEVNEESGHEVGANIGIRGTLRQGDPYGKYQIDGIVEVDSIIEV